MAFERFTDIGRVFTPRATIRSTGQIGFNHGSVRRFEMEKYAFVVLFYDKENKRVGVQLTNNKDEEGACTLSVKQGNGTVSARSFLEHYELMPEVTNQYPLKLDPESKLLVIQIGSGSQRTRKKAQKGVDSVR